MSGFVSLTLTPMLCARILTAPKHGREAGWFARDLRSCSSDSCRWFYRRDARCRAARRFLVLLVTFGPVGSTMTLYTNVPKGFFPERGHRLPARHHGSASDTSFAEMSRRQQIVVAIIKKDPAVE